MVIIELTDHSGKIKCALFGDYVDELNKRMGKISDGLPIVVIQFAKIKIFREKTSIQNVMNTTRIMLNSDASEVEKFKNRFMMKIKVRHGDYEAVLTLYDKDMEKLAVETCPLSLSMGESCSIYPDEM
ncbi:replication protein A 70 kDa DNA-binding subunit C [Trifolium repens]|nr:replication protein A 70 kDa DNA-binding subunit C [Trifolium repens]